MRNATPTDAYLRGVEQAKERKEAEQARLDAAVENFAAFHAKIDAKPAAEAQARAEKRREKYGDPPSNIVRIIVVPKGSRPLRVTPTNMSRRRFRNTLRGLRTLGFDSIEAFVNHVNSFQANTEAVTDDGNR